ncbi:MAG: polysaccharide deacetylase family protein [Bacteroidota bacterium]
MNKFNTLIFTLIAVTFINCGNKNNMDQNDESYKTWAEKLGYPKGKKVIMLHSDDVGMCEEANIATEKFLLNNEIQSAAIMMTCQNAEEFINWAIQNPSQDIGLHLTHTSEWKDYRWGTVTPFNEVPGLLDPDQKMWRSVREVTENATVEEVEKEIRSQIEKSIALGYRPDHIDTHMGTLYATPNYAKAFFSIAEEYGIPANVVDLSAPGTLVRIRDHGYPIVDEIVPHTDAYKLPKLDFFTSVPKGDTYKEKVENFKELIRDLKPGITEIIFHPSVETDNLKGITNSWQQRVWEANMFSDPDLISFFEKEGILFTNWKEMMKRFKSK